MVESRALSPSLLQMSFSILRGGSILIRSRVCWLMVLLRVSGVLADRVLLLTKLRSNEWGILDDYRPIVC